MGRAGTSSTSLAVGKKGEAKKERSKEKQNKQHHYIKTDSQKKRQKESQQRKADKRESERKRETHNERKTDTEKEGKTETMTEITLRPKFGQLHRTSTFIFLRECISQLLVRCCCFELHFVALCSYIFTTT